MQAIILAAGMGKRLGEYTKDNTKCMVQVNGVRLIDRMLTQLSTRDLSRVVIVVGYKKDELIKYIGDRYDDRIKIEYVHNDIYDKTNNISWAHISCVHILSVRGFFSFRPSRSGCFASLRMVLKTATDVRP